MRNYFEEMNIDYDELKRYEDIETYYDEVEDYTKLIQELQCDRVEALKQIVNKNEEIERLNNIISEFDNWLDLALEVFNNVDVKTLELVKRKLQELKGSNKDENK